MEEERRVADRRSEEGGGAASCRRLEAGPEGVGSTLPLRNTHWVGVFSVAERGGVSTDLTSIDTAGPDHPLRLAPEEKLATLPRARATRRAVHRARPALISLGA